MDPSTTLPTLTAERCDNVHLYYNQPSALGSIYTVKCPKLWIYFQPPHKEKTEVELKTDKNQYLTKFVDNEFETEMVIRGW